MRSVMRPLFVGLAVVGLSAAGVVAAQAHGHDDDYVNISKYTNAPSFASHNWGSGNWNSAARFGDLDQD
ncbi:hypothetical protein OEIGOIKO_07527 [Streptomyces chrestomyceticus JCM 4735]|uniref:Secreted protein n=1 Tax=Streptomyces chrestomyceticus JCM 4735 TaxID=1306181 RepID=A0A7U9L264_9ACTN|nr:hypothetical protein [Streptomyces chrestomyceticus]GCD39671.1 hypothetical protein OEIGOIKO_07527 [Streptomyces chrestomyceticus JCM 4735]